MEERKFVSAYLMGAYHERQKAGNAVWDVSYYEWEPNKMQLEEARHSYKLFKKSNDINRYIFL
jgi:hypothetical protein